MIEWSELFATHIELVDQQHKKLFEMLNRLTREVEHGEQSNENLNEALDELVEYAYQHFVDEEMVIAKYKLDQRYASLQRMEHHSFVFDVGRMREDVFSDDDLDERFEKLIKFVASWLIYHTLRTDQRMTMQIEEIGKGKSPEDAYEYAHIRPLNPAINLKVLDAVLELWADAAERVQYLEEQLHLAQGEEQNAN